MKKIILATFFLGSLSLGAQSFQDDFESYSNGDYVAQKNNKWTTWGNKPGTSQDATVTDGKAHGGNNSVYFSSNTKGGGPVDLVLPFGQEYNTGTFHFETWIYVDNGSSAYMNLQANKTLGQQWALDMYINADKTMEMRSASGGTLLQTTYSQGKWFKFALDINLNSNNWELYIDGSNKGSFQCAVDQVAALDFYPLEGSSFYIDDIKYNYTAYTLPAVNLALLNIGGVAGNLAGMSVAPSVTVRNMGTQAITSYALTVSYNGNQYTASKSGSNLTSTNTETVTLTQTIPLVAGKKDVIATLTSVNGNSGDADASDDSKTLSIDPVIPAPDKVVVAEEGTGTWCQWCPRGAVFLKAMHDKYGDMFAGIAVHNSKSDPMQFQPYDSIISGKVTGFPSVLVDRGAAIDPSGIEGDFLKRIVVAPSAVLVNGAKINANGDLSISIKSTFKKAVNGDYRIALVITEDSIHGTGSGYNQANAYAGGNSGVMGGFEILPNPVPAAKMYYDHVARLICPSFYGAANSYPQSNAANDVIIHNFTLTPGSNWKNSRLHIIGLLIDPQGNIDNASTSTLDQAVANGFTSGTNVYTGVNTFNNMGNLRVYPNPSNGLSNIALSLESASKVRLEIYTVDGRMVTSRDYGQLNSGDYTLPVNTVSWTPGIYMARIICNGQIECVKLMVE